VEREAMTLPPGWAWTTLGEIARINYRDPAIRNLNDDLPVTFAPMAAVDAESGTIALPEERPLSKVRKGFTSFCEDDVIFAKITPCMENGKAAIARVLVNGLDFGSTEFHVLRPEQGVLPEWIFYFVRQSSFREDAKASFAGTAGQLRVPSSFLESHTVSLAPPPEQHRIVAEIEKQFTRLHAGVAALRRAQANIKRYKASVLKAACEGRLVPQDPNDEPASKLLERILAERRKRWEEDLRAKGEDPSKAKYIEPAPPATEGLPELPEGWWWATVE
jgi:type I restriction enzyme S subunit